MKYFAAQVKTRSEEKYIKLFRAIYPQYGINLYFPLREMRERREGVVVPKRLPVFPGYIFVELDDEEDIVFFARDFRKIDGFYRFLKSNIDIRPLEGRDLELALHFIKKRNAVAGVSKVYFNENDKIVVVYGALQGLEGQIVKIDKRKGRAKIKMDLCGEGFLVDLAFETIAMPSKNKLSS
ncbi:transcriptional antiterminator NusG [Spirochaetia bacterium]|nr:transcriptional antiterminator NusG [Spirochaetia bacterium]